MPLFIVACNCHFLFVFFLHSFVLGFHLASVALSSCTPCYNVLPVSEIMPMHFKINFFSQSSFFYSCTHHAMFKSIVHDFPPFKDFEVLGKILVGYSLHIHQSDELKAHNFIPMEHNTKLISQRLALLFVRPFDRHLQCDYYRLIVFIMSPIYYIYSKIINKIVIMSYSYFNDYTNLTLAVENYFLFFFLSFL